MIRDALRKGWPSGGCHERATCARCISRKLVLVTENLYLRNVVKEIRRDLAARIERANGLTDNKLITSNGVIIVLQEILFWDA